MHDKGYDSLDAEKKSLWQRVKSKVEDFINRILEGRNIPLRVKLTEQDLSYMMWKLFKHKQRKAAGKPAEGDIFDKAEEIVRREEWKKSQDSMEIAAREGGNNQTMADRARAVIEQPAIEIEPHNYSKEELKRVYASLPSIEKDGRIVRFFNSGFGKNYRADGNFVKIIPQLGQLLDAAPFAYSTPDELGGQKRKDGSTHKIHRNVTSFDNYVAKANIGDKGYYVRIVVQNTPRPGENGVHSSMVTNVEPYENPAALNSLPIIHGGGGQLRQDCGSKVTQIIQESQEKS